MSKARKLTPKQEKFACAYVETSNASEAYRRTYDVKDGRQPERIWSDASKVLSNPKVAQRVAELQMKAQNRTMVTVESLTMEMDENRARANELDQAATMQAATMGKAKLHGLLIERKDHTSSDGSMTPVGEVPASERLAQMIKAIKPKGEIE